MSRPKISAGNQTARTRILRSQLGVKRRGLAVARPGQPSDEANSATWRTTRCQRSERAVTCLP